MRINLHKSPLYLYININELDSLRKLSLFEDYDETIENYNKSAKKKAIVLLKKIESLPIEKNFNLVSKNKNFYSDYFTKKNVNK